MTGQAHWLPVAALFVAALPVAWLWIRDRLEERKYLVERRNVRCRARDNRLVQVQLVRDAKTHDAIGIRECSEHAQCDKGCLPLFAHVA